MNHRFAILLLLGTFLASWPGRATAELVAYEGFEYAGLNAPGDGPADRGWRGPWVVECGSPGMASWDPAASRTGYFGDHVVLEGNTRIARPLDVGPEGPAAKAGLVEEGRLGKEGKTLYVGFVQRVSAAPDTASGSPNHIRYYAVEFKTAGGDERRVLDIGHDDRSAPAEACYGVSTVVNNGRSDAEPGQFRSLGREDAEANHLVVKFTFGPRGQDVVEIYRNPASPTEEPARPDAVLRGDFRFDRIALARFAGQAPVHAVDEIRMGTRYADAFTPLDAQRKTLRDARLRAQARRAAAEAQRLQAALKGLAGKADRLLFVKRHAFRPSHIYTEFSDGPYRPGGGIFVLSPPAPDGKVTRLFDAGGGICRDPEVSFDGKRILFSYRPAQKDFYHVYEMNADGSGLRQLTRGPFHDLDPFYLPDGRIGMTSSRCKSRTLCFWVQAATLFVMEADGSRPRPLTANNVTEFTPDLLPDGRILYTRWEYLDKSAIFVQSLWSILPDGTRAQQIYGNNLIHPVSMLQARLVPGTGKFACTLAAHNGNSYGPLAIVDPSRGVENPEGILNLAPEVNYGRGCFAPLPIDDRWCLVSYGPDEPFGIWLFGIAPPSDAVRPGRKEHPVRSPQFPGDLGTYWRSATSDRFLVYRDPEYSCVEAIPIAARQRPPVVAASVADSPPTPEETATLVLLDVNRGLDGAVARGRVKYLRVVEEMGHRDGQGCRNYLDGVTEEGFHRRYGSFMSLYAAPWESGKPAPSLQAKYVYGTVPVEADGSAHFTIPADRPVYFSALDEDDNEIQRMRSYIHLKPGERLSCIGCHEPRHTAPPSPAAAPLALRRGPSTITPPSIGAGAFSYQRLVQPVLDRRCAGCHAGREPAGGLDLSGKRDSRGVPASFSSLVRPRTNPARPPLVHFFDSWWGESWTVPVARPLSFGAAVSPLMQVIDSRHGDLALGDADRERMRMTSEERLAVTTWIDLNCPLWDTYSPELHLAQDPPR